MLLYECWALIGLGQTDESLRVLEEYRDRGGDLTGMRNTALEFRAHGQEGLGRQVLNEALTRIDAEPGEAEALRPTRGEMLYYLERWEEARGIFTELLPEDPTSVSYLGFLGRIAARLGEREEAMRISDELAAMDSPYLFGQNTLRRARIAAILGDTDRAVSLLQQAHREGVSFSLTLHTDVDLESLRGHPAFEEFMRPRG